MAAGTRHADRVLELDGARLSHLTRATDASGRAVGVNCPDHVASCPHEVALAVHRELGANHRELLTALDLLAQAYESLGRVADARQCWLEAALIGDGVDDPRAAEFRGRVTLARRAAVSAACEPG